MNARFSLALLSLSFAAACGGDDGEETPVDASIDGATAAGAVMVTCPASPAATVVTTDASNAYMPMATTITQGQVVKFTMSSSHNVATLNAASDPALLVGFGQERCFMFTKAGTFSFKCSPNGFTGSVTVN